jgi:ribose-phosphate pyrophosphokinase
MKAVIFSLPGNKTMGKSIQRKLNCLEGQMIVEDAPGGELRVSIKSDLENRDVILLCSLSSHKHQYVLLYYISEECRKLGAKRICLVSPYLPYIRIGHPRCEQRTAGARNFIKMISSLCDSIITADLDPTLRDELQESFRIPNMVAPMTAVMGSWVKWSVSNPLLVATNHSSKSIAQNIHQSVSIPILNLEKVTKLSKIDPRKLESYTPVIVQNVIVDSDEISKIAILLRASGYSQAICVGAHGVFNAFAYEEILAAGVDRIATSNSIEHRSNVIDLTSSIAETIQKLLNTSNRQTLH